jgi:hypothetical protein
MTEILDKAPHDIDRERLQNRLANIDHDPDRLGDFVGQLYRDHPENPQIFYAAATHLTALTHLDQHDQIGQLELPPRAEAAEAFSAYTRLLHMMRLERDSPRYLDDDRIRRRLAGSREELAFHATLAYARSRDADFVALPTPARLDYRGANQASDLRVFFPRTQAPPLEMQIKFGADHHTGYDYDPRIAVLDLATALGSTDKATEVRGLLTAIGEREDGPEGLRLPKREHNILLSASASILQSARWQIKGTRAS